MLKIIHTSDIHLDVSFANEGLSATIGQRRRETLRKVFRSILDRAAAWPADAVLIAGDLFEHERVSRDTVLFLRDCFERIAPIPVFIAPGNCDPCMHGSPYSVEEWPDNVHIFVGPEWEGVKLEQVPLTVYGFGFDGPEPSRNPFGALRVPEDGRVHVAVAHGTEDGQRSPGKRIVAPFSAETMIPQELHYMALGHFHQAMAIRIPSETKIHYSGAPEPLGFHDTGAFRYLEVTIDTPSGEPPRVRVNPCPVNQSAYFKLSVDSAQAETADALESVIRVLLHDSHHTDNLVRLSFRDCAPANLDELLPLLRERLSELIAHLDYQQDEGHAWENNVDLAGETSLGAFLARLEEEIRDAPDSRLERMLTRARMLGYCAYSGQSMPLRTLERMQP